MAKNRTVLVLPHRTAVLPANLALKPSFCVAAARFVRGRWSLRILLSSALIGLVLLVLHGAKQWAQDGALKEATLLARNTSQLNAALLHNNLEKFRTLPFVLTRDFDVRTALETQTSAVILALDEKLDALSREVDAAAIYVLDKRGYAIAASNWREPATFVGVDYQFRPYFKEAITQGAAAHFALGTVSHEAGLYLSRRVNDAQGNVLGVVVLKVNFRALEADWRQSNAPIFITDEQGVVLLSSLSGWRFHVLAPLSTEVTTQLRRSLQFGEAAFHPLPLNVSLNTVETGKLVYTQTDLPSITAGAPLLHTALPVADSPGWTLHMLTPVQPLLKRASINVQLSALLALGLLLALVVFFLFRRDRQRERTDQQSAIRDQLSAQVHERTAQLRHVNAQLLAQMDERQRTEARLHTLQDELVQASKLALLGQITAGVAHEINQPVAAIRSYADNAREFLQRQDIASTQDNLSYIASLTERIGHITNELRAFSRKTSTHLQAIRLNDALDGALLLIGPRTRRQAVHLQRPPTEQDFTVWADRIRLEQVLVNLLQNALDALSGQHDGRITLSIEDQNKVVRLFVRDNGPGLSKSITEHLFTPFSTTKPEGLGLGLVISRDIVAEFGGDLSARSSHSTESSLLTATEQGATFVLTLNKAEAPPQS